MDLKDIAQKVVLVIDECTDPINNTIARNLRDDALSALALLAKGYSREQVESMAISQKERMSLHWFYTRFIHCKYLQSGAGRSV